MKALITKAETIVEVKKTWTKEIAAAYHALQPRQKTFVASYIRKMNGAAAYREAYNPNANNATAAVCAARLLTDANIRGVLEPYLMNKERAMQFVQSGYTELATANKHELIIEKDKKGRTTIDTIETDAPDYKARKDGLDGLTKIHGLNAPDTNTTDRLDLLVQHITINNLSVTNDKGQG